MSGRGEAMSGPSRPVPLEGWMALRVRYCECDPMGVAHHASYLPWLEMSRTELLRESGVSYRDMEAAGVFLVVTRMEVRYRRPIVYDDALVIRTRVVGGGRARLDHEYELFRAKEDGSAGELLATASSTLACVDRDRRPRPLPEWLTHKARS